MKEDHGKQEDREMVRPEERPVGEVQLPGVRGRVHQEEQEADGVEVQRCAIRRAAKHYHGPDEQAEEAEGGQVVEQRDVALGQGSHGQLEGAALGRAEERVGHPIPRMAARQPALQLRRRHHLVAVHAQQHVTHPKTRPVGWSPDGDARGHDALRPLPPEDAVVEQSPGGFEEDVVGAEAREQQGDRENRQVLDGKPSHSLWSPPDNPEQIPCRSSENPNRHNHI